MSLNTRRIGGYSNKGFGMIVGILGLGIVSGLFAAGAALFTGQSILIAFLAYMMVGTLISLTATMGACVICRHFRDGPLANAHPHLD